MTHWKRILWIGWVGLGLASGCTTDDELSVAEAESGSDGSEESSSGSDESGLDFDAASDPDAIVGGTPGDIANYPWLAQLHIEYASGEARCGGSLITPRHVITAAHCVMASGGEVPRDIEVLFGSTRWPDNPLVSYGTRRWIIHPKAGYVGPVPYYDVAILELDRAVEGRTPIEIASPESPSHRALWADGASVKALGWGRTCQSCAPADLLQEVTMPVMPDIAVQLLLEYFPLFRPDEQLAAGLLEGGVGVCRGDSGGPLLATGPNGPLLVGISSWGVPSCSTRNRPSIFAEVGGVKLHRWIRSVIHETPLVGDVDGDGDDDIVTVTHNEDPGPLAVYVALSDRTRFVPAGIWQGHFGHRIGISALGDYDGDGMDDLWTFLPDAIWIAISSGHDFNERIVELPATYISESAVPVVGRFNNDAFEDVAYFRDDGSVHVGINFAGFGFVTPRAWISDFFRVGQTPAVGDVDGDGDEDIAAFQHGVGGSGVMVARSDGRRAFTDPRAWFTVVNRPGEVTALGDFNRDHRADAFKVTRDAMARTYVNTSDGSGFWGSVRSLGGFGSPTSTYLVGDANGDERADLIEFTQNAAADVNVALSNGTEFAAPSRWHDYFSP